MSTIAQSAINRIKALLWIVFLFLALTLNGCMERPLTRPTPQMDVEPKFWVRVLLLEDVKTCILKSACPVNVVNPQTQSIQSSLGQSQEPAIVKISAGKISIDGQSFTNKQLIISPQPPHVFNLNGDDYRGKLKLLLNPGGNSFDAINLIPIEPYLAGVVGAEMPDYWEPEALKAQAVAARTYCLYIKKRFGKNRHWDVRKTQANQVYLGIAAESAQIWNIIDRTNGQVLVCNQQDGTEGIFPAYYSSTCGGHTENSTNVFGGELFEPLTGVPCRYCRGVAKASYFFWPMVKFDKHEITTRISKRYPKLKKLGQVKNIVPTRQSNYGKFSRLTSVKLIGSNGKNGFLRAEDLRLTIDPSGNKMKSTICKIANMGQKLAFLSGRGYGHGVGMCQCGAQGMAREGKTARQILSYYYTGSNVFSIDY